MGFVGGITSQVFEKVHEIFPYDKYKNPYNTEKNIQDLAKNSELVFLCVPTPMKPSGEMDYSAVYNSLDLLDKGTKKTNRNPEDLIVVVRSTAVSGTTDKLAEQYKFRFVFNPEFLREKHALEDMKNTDRVVIGANTKENFQKVMEAYTPLFPKAKYINVDRKTAEMIKYSANVMLAGQVALANELYQICQVIGVDYNKIKEIILLDKRIARNLDVPGPDGDFGFGGKCFPKDLNALIYLAREQGYRPDIFEEIWKSNISKFRKNKNWFDIAGATSGNKDFAKE